jgi:FKBP-type peptidyl-prolyl cis-trans isomerase FklB
MLKTLPAIIGGLGLIASTSVLADESLKSFKDKTSYIMGQNLGQQLSKQKGNIAIDKVIMGISDAYKGNASKLSEKQQQEVVAEFKQRAMKEQQAKQANVKIQGDKNKKEGATFLAANKKKDGVITLPSGLQYKVLTKGSGATPKTTDTVKTHYRGNLIDGLVFDSSYKRGQPASFPVTGVIKGWTEALQKMKVGGKWQLFVPSDLAYGEHGAGKLIGANAVLIFEIELLAIVKKS